MPNLARFILLMVLPLALAAQDTRAPRPQQDGSVAPATEARVALVIGNGAYKDAPLKNPVNDARAMGETLRACGFQVSVLGNASLPKMREGLRDFGNRIARGGVGLFYYAGHGVQVKGRNYLIPTEADIQAEDEIAGAALDMDSVLAKLETARNRLNILILDACRNDPYARSFRSAGQGLAPLDAPSGTFIAFATAPGRTAADGSGDHGLYTGQLLEALRLPETKLEDIFKHVLTGVRGASNNQQTPWTSSSVEGDFYFVPPGNAPPNPVPHPTVTAAPQSAPTQRGSILFFRKSHWLLGAGNIFEIEIDGRILGSLRPGEFFTVLVPAGSVTATSAIKDFKDSGRPTVELDVKPGQCTYVLDDFNGFKEVPAEKWQAISKELKNLGEKLLK